MTCTDLSTKQQIKDDYEYLRVGYDASIARLMKLGMSDVTADNFLFNTATPSSKDEEQRLRLMEGGL